MSEGRPEGRPPPQRDRSSRCASRRRSGPPPLRFFGLVLHHDGSWSHQGHAVRHPRLRAAFDRSVRFLAEEGKYVVQLGRFRG